MMAASSRKTNQTTSSKKRSPKKPLGVLAYDQICRKIVTLEYRPREFFDEKRLMSDLGLGRTPVREALMRLAGEGWIELQPNKGAIVPPITIQSIKAVFEAMRVLEVGVRPREFGSQNTEPFVDQMIAANQAVKEAQQKEDILGLD